MGSAAAQGDKRAVTARDLETALARLGLTGADAVVHSSLRSFGRMDGGAGAVVDTIVSTFRTVLMPAFCFESNAPPPSGDRPEQNGCDYAFYAGWSRPQVPFRVESAGIDASMGSIPRRFAALPDALRSDHPWHSWIGRGPDAERLLLPHPWETSNVPLERLAGQTAFVVLIGVALTACTAVHVAEERAGRRPFIRWATDRDGSIRRVRAAGCSKGFGALEPFTRELFEETLVGTSRIRVAPLEALIARCAEVIEEQPSITVCSPACVRCRDSERGGPLDGPNRAVARLV